MEVIIAGKQHHSLNDDQHEWARSERFRCIEDWYLPTKGPLKLNKSDVTAESKACNGHDFMVLAKDKR
jgi:hypothetical protein